MMAISFLCSFGGTKFGRNFITASISTRYFRIAWQTTPDTYGNGAEGFSKTGVEMPEAC